MKCLRYLIAVTGLGLCAPAYAADSDRDPAVSAAANDGVPMAQVGERRFRRVVPVPSGFTSVPVSPQELVAESTWLMVSTMRTKLASGDRAVVADKSKEIVDDLKKKASSSLPAAIIDNIQNLVAVGCGLCINRYRSGSRATLLDMYLNNLPVYIMSDPRYPAPNNFLYILICSKYLSKKDCLKACLYVKESIEAFNRFVGDVPAARPADDIAAASAPASDAAPQPVDRDSMDDDVLYS